MINQISNSKIISIDTQTNIIKMFSKFDKTYIENEIKMLQYLSNFGIFTPEIINYNKNNGEMTQRYYPNTSLFKLFSTSYSHTHLSNSIKNKIRIITDILKQNTIFIDDFQFIYDDENIILIDPSGVYHLTESKSLIFSCVQNPNQIYKKKISEVTNGFFSQIKHLENILDNK